MKFTQEGHARSVASEVDRSAKKGEKISTTKQLNAPTETPPVALTSAVISMKSNAVSGEPVAVADKAVYLGCPICLPWNN